MVEEGENNGNSRKVVVEVDATFIKSKCSTVVYAETHCTQVARCASIMYIT